MDKSYKLIISGKLPGLNEYIKAERTHRQAAAKLKKQTQEYITWFIRTQLKGVKIDRPVFMEYTWIEPDKRRDKSNISAYGRKVIEDALVRAKVIVNDGWAHIKGFSDVFDVDKASPRVEVVIRVVE